MWYNGNMTKTLTLITTTLILAIAAIGCLPTPTPYNPVANSDVAHLSAERIVEFDAAPAAAPAVVVWPNDGQPHGNIAPPTRLDVANTTRDECNDMGGTHRLDGTCEGVDY